MESLVFQSACSFFGNMLEYTTKQLISSEHKGLGAVLNLSGEFNGSAYIITTPYALAKMSEKFLFISDPDDETMMDLIKEVLNIIAGHVKILGEDNHLSFNISTPRYLGQWETSQCNSVVCHVCVEYEGDKVTILVTDTKHG